MFSRSVIERRHTKGKSVKGKKYRGKLQKKAESTVHTTEIDIESGGASKDHCIGRSQKPSISW